MKVSVEKLPTSEAVVDVEIPWEEVEQASNSAYRKLVQKVDIQGFRRGKAPRSLLERRFGKEYIYQEGLDDLISEAYRKALQEHQLTPITQPRLDAPVFEMGQPYHFSLTVPIITPVELGDYHALHFEREEAEVTSEEVDKELEALRNRQAEWQTVERPADYNDRVTVDLKLTSGEQKISDLKDNTFEMTHERHGIFTGMDEQIVGMKAGETKTFSTTIPADYTNEKLAGKQADYIVTLHKVEEKRLPELDDAFAAKASEGQFETLEDLSKALSDSILENKKRRIRDDLREKVLNAVIEQSKFTLHPLLIDEEVDEMIHQLTHMLEQQRLSLDQYLLMMRKNLDEYKKELRPDAERRVKRQLVLAEVARRENLEVTAEELEALYNAYAQLGQPLPRTEAQLRSLALSYQREKAFTRLVEIAAGPDPDQAEEEQATEEQALEESEAAPAAVENAQVAASAASAAQAAEAETAPGESHTTSGETGESATVTSQVENSTTEDKE
ncbi:MAG: trigger factor [Ktedonobacteraceae bacterium]|nr:trigger factor [Ktedonobacteraceae bacterium]